MGKLHPDADYRRFFDEFACVRVSRLRATGVIDPAKRQSVIPFSTSARSGWPRSSTSTWEPKNRVVRAAGGLPAPPVLSLSEIETGRWRSFLGLDLPFPARNGR